MLTKIQICIMSDSDVFQALLWIKTMFALRISICAIYTCFIHSSLNRTDASGVLMENLKQGGGDRETGRGEVGTRESGTRMLMLAYGGRQGGGGGGRTSVSELRVKRKKTHAHRHREARRILGEDHPKNAVAEVGKFLRRTSLVSDRPSCPLPRVVSLLFLSGGRQQIDGGRRCARSLWKKGQLRMLLCRRNGSDRPAERWACTVASAPFRLPSLRKAVCLSFIYLFINLFGIRFPTPTLLSLDFLMQGRGGVSQSVHRILENPFFWPMLLW